MTECNNLLLKMQAPSALRPVSIGSLIPSAPLPYEAYRCKTGLTLGLQEPDLLLSARRVYISLHRSTIALTRLKN